MLFFARGMAKHALLRCASDRARAPRLLRSTTNDCLASGTSAYSNDCGIAFHMPMLGTIGAIFVLASDGLTGASINNALSDSYCSLCANAGHGVYVFAGWHYVFPRIAGYAYPISLARFISGCVSLAPTLTSLCPQSSRGGLPTIRTYSASG